MQKNKIGHLYLAVSPYNKGNLLAGSEIGLSLYELKQHNEKYD